MEEKKVEENTPEEILKIHKKNNSFYKARRNVQLTFVSFFAAAFISVAGLLPSCLIAESLTNKQAELVDDLCNSSVEYHELYTNQLNGLRSDLVSNKITDSEYIESVKDLNSEKHKKEVLFTLNDVDLTEYYDKQQALETTIKIRTVFAVLGMGASAVTMPLLTARHILEDKHFKYKEKYKEILLAPEDEEK